ncbi:hypothetical protein A3C23_02605 [Candidatus Roizmanbacteria bacterium RIFCSPHIGHO2_02_FULL_37_13b]|uniref:Glycosyltransferase 2-like domain-containing protein n=1 Tax=Candidatus Roizmanbacteria bacterium RIFCSPLOWO2_02_FULL_36_11 TaxID=1802071 RepID=A0A1F7JG35_9BACT|nr:MAG: hypothetical protein A3C23_02605 [Candidatus Roizmanbacteria bacterium RIFCSPHIGHO2_02_FULL_37_13b]OGK54564.1 MAG: hypothetical protein A3H78_01615 [Candidatus Roizmanbacteria bacterium RIFCSPLOWO2_02_FULL_36_11]
MKDIKLSIIIPTYERTKDFAEILNVINKIIENLSYVEEMLIVDDNRNKEFKKYTINSQATLKKFRCLTTNHRGSAAARNFGIRSAKGNVILFLDDDILPSIDSINNHYNYHQKNRGDNKCLVGKVITPKKISLNNSFTRNVDEQNLQFGKQQLSGIVDFRYFYTCNVSMKKNFMLKHGLFNEIFKDALYDDIELAYRLEKKGLQIYFDKKNIVEHFKQYDYLSLTRRYKMMGYYAKKLLKLHPELSNSFINLKPTIKEYLLIFTHPFLNVLRAINVNYFEALLIKSGATKYFFIGLNS